MGDWASGMTLPDIPRLYTAVAEWLACMICILQMEHSMSRRRLWITAGSIFAVQALFLVLTDNLMQPVLWLLCMIVAIGLMYLFLYICGTGGVTDTAYHCVEAFVLAEFAASLGWQLYCFSYYEMDIHNLWINGLILVGIFVLIYGSMWKITKRYIGDSSHMDVTLRELLLAVIIGLSVFLISNLAFVFANTPFGGRYSSQIFNIRTLIDLGGLAILYAYHIQRENLKINYELEMMETMLENQYHQYEQSKETLDLINYKYHDLKHMIIALRAEENDEKRREWLDQMEADIVSYESQNKTGNKVLDILLTSKSLNCRNHQITFTSVVDGALLAFMEAMDICSIFGNALDNAIECEKKIADPEKRLIHLSVFSQKSFLIIRCENYCEDELHFEKNLPKTTKEQKGFHGFGLKSIRHIVHQYNGEVDVGVQDNFFSLKILIPMDVS